VAFSFESLPFATLSEVARPGIGGRALSTLLIVRARLRLVCVVMEGDFWCPCFALLGRVCESPDS